MKYLCLALFLFSASLRCLGQEGGVMPFEDAYKRMYSISRASGAPLMDGRLDEAFWTGQGEWTDVFVQVTPFERETSDSPTRAKLLYDGAYIYVAVYCKDAHPEKIIRFIGNRDENNIGDLISIAFDTYHDYRAATEFNINVGGNKTDLIVTDKLEVNRSWNAVWEGRTHVDMQDSSWTAELRIPFSQLRYNSEAGDGIWGLHIRRIIRRNNEVQNWSMIPLKNNGHIFSFGLMQGMTGLPRSRGIEILPYTMLRYRKEPPVPGNPYRKGERRNANAGFDMKFGLSDFTLDLTVNPDFGQIELDPSVMNLTAYETFYDEKRPFFLEGKHILDFASGSDMMFYTRRIGAAPSRTPSVDNVTSFAETKDNVPIIGALKLTGTNRSGLTIGMIQSLTARSSALVSREGSETREALEPLTSYTVARVQKNWKGNRLLGGMLTYVNRAGESPAVGDRVNEAFTAGVDFTQYFNNRLYYVDMKGMFSSLSGSRNAILILQQNPVHYYQRLSASDYLGTDADATSLRGTGGYVKAGHKGNSKWAFSETFSWASPGFDLNTVGYLKQADFLSANTEIEFRRTTVWKSFRSNTVSLSQQNQWDFGGRPFLSTLNLGWKTMLLNRYEWTLSGSYGWNYFDTRKLRGGGDLRYDPYLRTTAAFNTDKAKPMVFTMNYVNDYNFNGINKLHTLKPALSLRMGDNVHIAGEFTYTYNVDNTQFVSTVLSDRHPVYLMGRMEQQTYGLTMKLQVNLTPDISLQFYGSPFTSAASYDGFKKALDTRALASEKRFREYLPQEIALHDGSYTVDAQGESFSFGNPDFSFNEFRSNLVARWEYRPGSTLYFVWEHRMSDRGNRFIPGWDDNIDRMFSLPSTNTFMLKLNYWFNL
jgi:hypothetical protein